MLILIIFSFFLTAFNEKIKARYDENNITPSDFTVMAYNIPKNTTSKELKEWLSD